MPSSASSAVISRKTSSVVFNISTQLMSSRFSFMLWHIRRSSVISLLNKKFQTLTKNNGESRISKALTVIHSISIICPRCPMGSTFSPPLSHILPSVARCLWSLFHSSSPDVCKHVTHLWFLGISLPAIVFPCTTSNTFALCCFLTCFPYISVPCRPPWAVVIVSHSSNL